MNKLSLIKSISNLTHIKSINNLSIVKTIIELSIIDNIYFANGRYIECLSLTYATDKSKA